MLLGPDWKGIDDYVFTTAWGEPVHPATVSSLMATLINVHNRPDDRKAPIDPLPVRGFTTCAISAPRPCCSLVSRSTWSLPGSVTPIRPSRSGCTRTS
jgi:hypothetical protein